jgi:hypothetical protein
VQKNMTEQEQVQFAVAAAIEAFGETFGLWGFPGDTFRISPVASKHFMSEGEVQIVVEVLRGIQWLDMGRDTAAGISREVVALEGGKR